MGSSVIFNSSADIGGCRFEISIDKGWFDTRRHTGMLHNHADYEVHIIKKGAYSFDIYNRRSVSDQNSIFVIPPSSYHNTAVSLKDDSSKYCFRFSHSCNSKEGRILSDALKGIETPFILKDCSHIIQLADEIHYEYQNQQLDYQKCIGYMMSIIMLYILRKVMDRVSQEKTDERQHIHENRTSAIDEFFAANYMNDIHSYDLSEYMNLSIRQLDRVLRKHYNMTFKQKLTGMRIFVAKRLLIETKLPVMEISQKAGYNSTEHFCSIFVQKTGHTPSSFRKVNSVDIYNL